MPEAELYCIGGKELCRLSTSTKIVYGSSSRQQLAAHAPSSHFYRDDKLTDDYSSFALTIIRTELDGNKLFFSFIKKYIQKYLSQCD